MNYSIINQKYYVLSIRYYPRIQFKVSKFQSFNFSTFHNFKDSKLQSFTFSKRQGVKVSRFQKSNMEFPKLHFSQTVSPNMMMYFLWMFEVVWYIQIHE